MGKFIRFFKYSVKQTLILKNIYNHIFLFDYFEGKSITNKLNIFSKKFFDDYELSRPAEGTFFLFQYLSINDTLGSI